MMGNRPIKFREYLPDGRPEKFHYWGLIDGNFIAPCNPKNTHDRFTGLTDKEGNEIYESDRWGAIDGLNLEGTIVMHEGSWSIKWGNGYYGDLWAHVRTKSGKVVGTIHQ